MLCSSLAGAATNTVVRFEIWRGGTNAFGALDVELFDTDKPETVRNFLLYVRSGAYSNMFFHRCVPGFVVQGGGFTVTNLLSDRLLSTQYREVTNYGRLGNEFATGPKLSNTVGTIAMAKIGNDPDSASSQWFFNLGNNTNLDVQNGGFTVFGRIISDTNNVVAHFNGLTSSTGIVNQSSINSAFGELPVSYPGTRPPNHRDLYGMQISILNQTNPPGQSPPTIQIVSPPPNSTFTNQSVTISGTTGDDTGVARVMYRYGTNAAQNASGTTNWQVTVSPQRGLNSLSVECIDWDGNRSTAASVTFLYVAQVPLDLRIQGSGRVVGAVDGQYLQVGSYYTLGAIPSAGWIFHSWSGTMSSSNASITFLVQTNATNISLTAKFVTEPMPRLAGEYRGLFRPTGTPNLGNSGHMSLLLEQDADFSGNILHRGVTYDFAGKFDADGEALIQGSVGGVQRAFSLKLEKLNDAGLITGDFGGGEVRLERVAATNSYGIPTGRYTFVIPPAAFGATDQLNPGGYGFGSCTVNAWGTLTFNGRLGDNQVFSGTAPLTRLRNWPIYLESLNGRGALLGWVTASTNVLGNLDGNLHWIKGFQANDATYPGGFSNQVVFLGSRYPAPLAGERVVDWVHALAAINGPFQIGISNIVKLTLENTLYTVGQNVGGTTWNLDPITGMLTGSFTDPWSGTARTIRGVVLKRSQSILGQFVDRGTVGSVILNRAPFLVTQRVESVTLPEVLAVLKEGGYLKFATNVDVTFTEPLTFPYDTALDANGHSVVFRGGQSTRLFRVMTNRTFFAKGITFADGSVTGTAGANTNPPEPGGEGRGAGIMNLGGLVALTNCVLTNFVVQGGVGGKDKQAGLVAAGGRAVGAAIYNQAGRVILHDCRLADNLVFGGIGDVNTNAATPPRPTRGSGAGGAVFSEGGECTIQSSTFLRNAASGGPARLNGTNLTRAGEALGGAVAVSGGRLQVSNSVFRANRAFGPDASTNNQTQGGAHGGAIFVETNVIATFDLSTFAENLAIGGNSAWGQPSGDARGGAILNRGSLQVRRSTIEQNSASSGSNGVSGTAAGGGIASFGNLGLDASTLAYNLAKGGGSSTNGWMAGGGGLFCQGASFGATNCTIVFNSATADAAEWVRGGGIMLLSNSAAVLHVTVAFNSATGTNAAGIEQQESSLRMRSSIVSSNAPRNFVGAVTDDEYNLSSDASGALTKIGSTNNVNPLLGPLADNGGPTRTMVLLVGSPARDRLPQNVTPAMPPVDQRGTNRTAGSRGDVGSVEIGTNEWPAIVSAPIGGKVLWGSNFTFHVTASGAPPLGYTWLSNDIPVLSGTNTSLSYTNIETLEASTVYRVVVTNHLGSVTSVTAVLAIELRPQLHAQPGDLSVSPGSQASFTAVVTGPDLSYTWFHDGSPVAGAVGPTLTFPAAEAGMQGGYRLIVTNFAGSTNTRIASLTFDSNALWMVQGPTNTTAFEGESAILRSTVTGLAPITYSWLSGVTPILNATNEQLVFAPAAISDAGTYRLVVTNAYLAITSAPAVLTVIRRPLLSINVVGPNVVIATRATPNSTNHLLQATSLNAQAWTVLGTNVTPLSGTSLWTQPLIRTQNVFFRAVLP